jgi:hypothetical protein
MVSLAVVAFVVLNSNEMLVPLPERILFQYAGTSVTLGIFLKDLLRDLTATTHAAFVLLFIQAHVGEMVLE